MERRRFIVLLVGSMHTLGTVGCSSSPTDGSATTDGATKVPPPDMVSLRACATDWFNNGHPVADWTVRTYGHDEIAPRVTDESGCTTVPLPARSEVLLLGSRPGALPEALTVHTEGQDLAPMYPSLGRAFTVVDASPWWGALLNSGIDGGARYDQGLVAVVVGRAGVDLSDTSQTFALTGVTPSLSPSLPGRWLFIGNTQQYDATLTSTGDPYGIGIFANNVPPGSYEITLQRPGGLRCDLDPERGGFGWPVPNLANTFRLQVEPGTFTSIFVQCETG